MNSAAEAPTFSSTATASAISFEHLTQLSDLRGLFEHADHLVPRFEHGYCTDDNARLLVVTGRADDTGAARTLSRLALAFLLDAQASDGLFHNRMDISGSWTDSPTNEDWWGRGVWALGASSVEHRDPAVRQWARAAFDRSVDVRSPWPHAMAFAALGAAPVLVDDPTHTGAASLLRHALTTIGNPPAGAWRWPLPRLTYANAAIAEAVIAAGVALASQEAIDRGLAMLEWLVGIQNRDGQLSVIGTDGLRSTDPTPRDGKPMFDQQPIEVAAIADACWCAFQVTGDSRWAQGVAMANAWFDGVNDCGFVMFDEASGGGYDGLHADRVNLNEGAESTLAFISTRQRGSLLAAPE